MAQLSPALPASLPPQGPDADVAEAVRAGLSADPRRLPPWLFYDARGSELFEAITALPEYYVTRAEHEVFVRHGAELTEAASRGRNATWIELGAGTATKTQVLLDAIVAAHGRARFVPVDVSATALEAAVERLAAEAPKVEVEPWVARHREAFERMAGVSGPKVALLIGSSIGNFEGADAVRLIAGIRDGLGAGDALVLGTDLVKPASVLVPAYDDAQGVTAAFNQNVLVRINRELGGDFVVDAFRHVAVWNAERSRMEMHLESTVEQRVRIAALGLDLAFAAGERIHTESSVKYDEASVDALLGAAGFTRERTWHDAERRFGVHLARAA